MKVRDAIKQIEAAGWTLVPDAGKGSHRKYAHPIRPGKVIVPGRPSDELKPGTWHSIKREAGI